MSSHLMVRERTHNLFILFLSRLFGWFSALTLLLSGVILASHYLITLRFLPAGLVTPSVLVLLLPQMVGHAVPVALCMSVGLVGYRLRVTHEYFLIVCLLGARRAWYRALAVTLGSCALFFGLCIGWWGPHYYACAKQEMVARIFRLVRVVPSDTVMPLSSKLTVWYASRNQDGAWCDARFYLRTKNRSCVLAAQTAELGSTAFTLRNGSIHEQGLSRSSYHCFGEMMLPYNISSTLSSTALRPKHATLSQLWRRRTQPGMIREIVRRIIHVILVAGAPLLILIVVPAIRVHQFLFVVIASIAGSAVMQIMREVAQLFV